MKMKKVGMALGLFAGVGVLCYILWMIGYHNVKRLDNIPSLALIKQEGEAFGHKCLEGYRRDQLIEIWGEPSVVMHSNEDIWQVDEDTAVRINYNGREEVVMVGVIERGAAADVESDALETGASDISADVYSETTAVDMSESTGGTEAETETEIESQTQISLRTDLDSTFLTERYIGRADLYQYTKEELRVLRNEIYARHGAIFQSEDLNTYFAEKSWYNGTISVVEFPEDLLSDVERANLKLLKEMESEDGLMIDGQDYRAEYETLQDAPYLSWLGLFSETAVEADMSRAKDMGVYYVAPGEIGIPLTITEDQLFALKDGAKLEIVVNDLTGETKMLKKNPMVAPSPNSFWFYEKGTEPDQYSDVANAYQDEKTGLYILWHMSDDTIMKTVYEGDIYILKGAVTGAHLSLELASFDQREVVPVERDAESWERMAWGNYLYHDGRGYFSGIYYLGD